MTRLYVLSIHSPTEGLRHGTNRAWIEALEREARLESRGLGKITESLKQHSGAMGAGRHSQIALIPGVETTGGEAVSLIERLYKKVITVPESGCHIWDGCVTTGGYGLIGYNYKSLYVHRVSYEHFVGAIPRGLEIDHLCRVRRCVNPNHLEAVTHRENGIRGIGMAAVNFRKTHCVNGHEFTESNTYRMSSDSYRWCWACRLASGKRYREKHKP